MTYAKQFIRVGHHHHLHQLQGQLTKVSREQGEKTLAKGTQDTSDIVALGLITTQERVWSSETITSILLRHWLQF